MSANYERLYPLVKAILILLLLFLIIVGLDFAQNFLVPITFAIILSMMLIPVCQYFEAKGLSRVASTFVGILLLVIFFLGLAAFLSTQIAGFSQDYPALQQQVKSQFADFRQFVQENLGVTPQEAVEGDSSGSMSLGSTAISFLGSFTIILANSLLTLVYLFMFINYRSHFSKFILKVVPDEEKNKTKRIVKDSGTVAQQYLAGRGVLIIVLAILYSIGLTIVGINHAILLSALAALISIIPYIGNIIGIAFPLLMAVVQNGGLWMIIGVMIVFAIAQFIESYILEPYIVGAEVNIHPFFTIVGIVAGELIWGVPGMILAIPVLAIIKIVMENIEPLQPYAFLVGDSDNDDHYSKYKNRLKKWMG